MPFLPRDVIHHIGEMVASPVHHSSYMAKEDLSICSMISRDWAVVTRRILFRTIRINNGDRVESLLDIISTNPQIPFLVRKLEIQVPNGPIEEGDYDGRKRPAFNSEDSEWLGRPQMSRLIALLTSITELSLENVDLSLGLEAVQPANVPLSITHIDMFTCPAVSWTYLERYATHLTKLQSVMIYGTHFVRDTASYKRGTHSSLYVTDVTMERTSGFEQAPMVVKELRLELAERNDPHTVVPVWFYEHMCPQSVKHLKLESINSSKLRAVWPFIGLAGSSLTSLTLQVENAYEEEGPHAPLAKIDFSKLRRLNIYGIDLYDSDWTSQVLKHIASCTSDGVLAEVDVHFVYTRDKLDNGLMMWTELDEIMAAPLFKSVQHLFVTISGTFSLGDRWLTSEDFCKEMPQSKERGILEVSTHLHHSYPPSDDDGNGNSGTESDSSADDESSVISE
jgi:hypothetical protein